MSRYLALIFFTLLFSSCKKDLYTLSFLDKKKLQIEEVDFNYFIGKTKITCLDDKQNLNANATIRIKKDSIIWISVTPGLGIEMLRAVILQDSICVIDRMNKSYYTFDFDSLSKKLKFEVDYNTIEAILFGNLIHPRSKNDKIEKGENYYILVQKNGDLGITNFINAKSMKIEEVKIEEIPTNNYMAINYHNFQPLEGCFFPFDYSINLLYSDNNKGVNTQINISYNRVAISNKKLRFPFNVPNKYESD